MIEKFIECFPAWRDDIASWNELTPRSMRVVMKNGHEYEFGVRQNGELYLRTLKPPAQ